MEFFIKKTKGKTTGWVGYTISKTNRNFNELNSGLEFPAKYDRTHDLSVTMSHEINKKWSVSAIFVYATGNTFTPPLERYVLDGYIITEFADRNSYRMIPYHRLDVSATYTRNKWKKFNSSWNFGIYNVYNRKNPYFVYFDYDGEGSLVEGGLDPKAYQVSLFPMIPSITWNFNF